MTLHLVGRHVAMPMSYSLVCSYIKDYRGVYKVNFVADMDHPNKDCDATVTQSPHELYEDSRVAILMSKAD